MERAIDRSFLMRMNQKRTEERIKNERAEEDNEEYYTYMKRSRQDSINDRKDVFRSVFDKDKAINTQPSVFDKGAVFHTTE